FAANLRVLIGSRIIASIRILDLDDLRTKIGKGLRAGRARNNAGKIHHQQTVEGVRRALRSWQTVRQRQSSSHGLLFPSVIVVLRDDFKVYSSGTTRGSICTVSLKSSAPHSGNGIPSRFRSLTETSESKKCPVAHGRRADMSIWNTRCYL